MFWWASSLTGIAAAFALIAFINSGSVPSESLREVVDTSPVAKVTPSTMPIIDWKTESAMLTEPLQKELEDLQSDIKKAEAKVRQDIGL